MRFTSCQRCASDNVGPHAGVESCPLVIFQKSEPSVSASMSLRSVKFAGLGVVDEAIGPSPRPVIPWHIAQSPLKRLWACFKFSAEDRTGFFTSLALCGASQLHATVPAHSRIANTIVTRPVVPNWKPIQMQLSLSDQEPECPNVKNCFPPICHATRLVLYQSNCAVEAISFLIYATTDKRRNRPCGFQVPITG
jgi:hypothetical protein